MALKAQNGPNLSEMGTLLASQFWRFSAFGRLVFGHSLYSETTKSERSKLRKRCNPEANKTGFQTILAV